MSVGFEDVQILATHLLNFGKVQQSLPHMFCKAVVKGPLQGCGWAQERELSAPIWCAFLTPPIGRWVA